MDQPQERASDAAPVEPKPEWTRPELSRIEAGVAEASDINTTDGSLIS